MEKVKNRMIFISVIILIIIMTNINPLPKQTIAPSCFEREDCQVSIKEGYCGVEYDCISGKCYHSFTICPEICYGGEDEDMDGLIDCMDTDCYDSTYCPCSAKPRDECVAGMCYCGFGKPYWVTNEEEYEFCRCI